MMSADAVFETVSRACPLDQFKSRMNHEKRRNKIHEYSNHPQ